MEGHFKSDEMIQWHLRHNFVGLEDFHGIHSDSVAVYVRQSRLRAPKSNMAAKNQDGGRKFLFLSTKKLRMVLKNYLTKNGAWGQSVTGISPIAYTNKQ